MAVQGSVLTNKYAEGYPDKRYYGGCEYVDMAEKLGHPTGPRSFSAPPASMFSPIPVPRPTWRSILPSWNPATPSWV
jgi:hypothetical protein